MGLRITISLGLQSQALSAPPLCEMHTPTCSGGVAAVVQGWAWLLAYLAVVCGSGTELGVALSGPHLLLLNVSGRGPKCAYQSIYYKLE